jgi:2-hydroxy-3-oxopropionate reductase
MAKHLMAAGYDVVVYDVVSSKMEPLLALGAGAGRSCKEVAEPSDVVISMVIDAACVERVYLGEDGVLAGARPGTLLIDMTTSTPAMARRVAAAAAEKSCPMLDAPVSGGDVGAEEATLSIMVGGERETYDKAISVLEVLGTPTWCGPSGSGQTVKACNQIQVTLCLVAMAEALVLGAKAGVDPAIVVKVLSAGYAQTRVMDVRGPRLIRGDFEPGGRCSIQHKDMNIVRETARELGCCLPASTLAHELYTAAHTNGWDDLDHSAVIKVIEQLSDVRVRTMMAEE